VTVTGITFQKLQSRAKQLHVPFCSDSTLPADRSVLENCCTTSEGGTIGEGTAVRYVGFVVYAKHSILGAEKAATANHHVHINLGKSLALAKCSFLRLGSQAMHAWTPSFAAKDFALGDPSGVPV
jgi:hypothetical protein